MRLYQLCAVIGSALVANPCVAQLGCTASTNDERFAVTCDQKIGVWRRPPYTVTFESSAQAYGLGVYSRAIEVKVSDACMGDLPACDKTDRRLPDTGTTSASRLLFDLNVDPNWACADVYGLYFASLDESTAVEYWPDCLKPAPYQGDVKLHFVDISLNSEMVSSREDAYQSYECTYAGTVRELGFTCGSASLPRTYTVDRHEGSGALECTHCLTVQATFTHAASAPACGDPPVLPPFKWILYVNRTKQVAGSAAVPDGSSSAGLLVLDESGVVARLGAFENSAFDVVVPEEPSVPYINGTLTWTTTLASDSDFGSSTTLDVTQEVAAESFSSDGTADFDADGVICWNDRVAMVSAMDAARDTSIGEVGYNPRCDVDLDGDVDDDDYSSYVNLFDSEVVCKADVNCSDLVSQQDIYDYLDLYYAGGRLGDFNNSGATTVQDIYDFLDAYYLPCPS